jgi:copper chaperone CopZ
VKEMSSKEDVFDVQDMHCNACVNTITKTLTNNSNIDNVDCDLDTKEVKVTYDDEQVDVEEILSALDTIGFPATIKKKP